MNTRLLVLLVAAALVTLLSPLQASAFDGERKGFMLNLGVGMGQGTYKVSALGASLSVDAVGFATDLKIGGGLSNNQVQIYYINRALWYSPDVDLVVETVTANFVNGMSGAGISYFLAPEAPSVFFSGALGIGVILDSDADESMSGFGYTVGVGFEFARNFAAELTYMGAGVSGDGDIDGIDNSISTIMLTVNWLAY